MHELCDITTFLIKVNHNNEEIKIRSFLYIEKINNFNTEAWFTHITGGVRIEYTNDSWLQVPLVIWPELL